MSGEMEAQSGDDTMLRPGQVVAGKYRVDRLIAEGGMAAVWAGTNSTTGKRVALKIILRSFAGNDAAAEMFKREALAASKINHPNVVSIFDVVDHQGMTCIVMELLEGETLAAFLRRRGALDMRETATLLLPAMRGVAAANSQGVIHRDLKPGNIFLCTGADGCLLGAKVLDFGVSVMAERVFARSSEEPNSFPRFGTPSYMAPEDVGGSAVIDARVDVYAFGVLLFECLTGRVPFVGEPNGDLLMRILSAPAPRVSELRPDLPVEVSVIVERALAKDPDERFPDVEHLIRATEDHLLPALSVHRSLSPIAGVSLLYVRDPMVKVPLRRPAQEPAPREPGRAALAWAGLASFAQRRHLWFAALVVGVALVVWAVALTPAAKDHHMPETSPVRGMPPPSVPVLERAAREPPAQATGMQAEAVQAAEAQLAARAATLAEPSGTGLAAPDRKALLPALPSSTPASSLGAAARVVPRAGADIPPRLQDPAHPAGLMAGGGARESSGAPAAWEGLGTREGTTPGARRRRARSSVNGAPLRAGKLSASDF
jgi:serine/threonine-protein kinase